MDKIHENMDYVSPASSVSVSKKVLLQDWWLIKVKNNEGVNKLGVGGMAWTGTKVSRVFNSAPVIKRYNAWNFEAADGVMVKIEGIINQSRTYQNGFSCEACSIFMTGFPHNWEIYVNWWFAKDNACESASTSISCIDPLLKFSVSNAKFGPELNLADVPVHRVFDYLSFSHGCSDQSQDCLDKVKKEEDELSECGDEPAIGFPERSFSTSKSRIQFQVETSFDKEKVIQSMGKVDICKETPTMVTERRSSNRLQNLKKERKEVELSECGDERFPERSFSTSKSRIQFQVETSFDKEKVIQSMGKVDICKETPTMATARRSSNRLQNLKKEKKEVEKSACSLKTKKSEASPDKVGQEKGSLECTPKVPGNPATRCMEEQFSLNSVGSLSLKNSRSGRLLIPNQAIWLNQKVVYDQDGGVIGIEKGHPETPSGNKTAPKKRKRKT